MTSEAEIIRRERVRQEISLEVMAENTGIESDSLLLIEGGQLVPDPLQLCSIAGALGIYPSDIRQEVKS